MSRELTSHVVWLVTMRYRWNPSREPTNMMKMNSVMDMQTGPALYSNSSWNVSMYFHPLLLT